MRPTIEFTLMGIEMSLISYTTMAVIAMMAALLIMLILLPKIGYRTWETVSLFILSAVFFLIGARLLNYMVNYEQYVQEHYSPFTLSFGHFSVYGGIILASFTVLIWASLQKKDLWLLTDTMTFPFVVSFALMRIGCFMNGCCYGKVCHNFLGVAPPPPKVQIITTFDSLLPLIELPVEKVYPTQLMEMGFALVFIPIGLWLYKTYAGKGFVFGLLIVYFSAFRWFVLIFRDLPYSDFVVNILYPTLYFTCIIIGLLILFLHKRSGSDTP